MQCFVVVVVVVVVAVAAVFGVFFCVLRRYLQKLSQSNFNFNDIERLGGQVCENVYITAQRNYSGEFWSKGLYLCYLFCTGKYACE